MDRDQDFEKWDDELSCRPVLWSDEGRDDGVGDDVEKDGVDRLVIGRSLLLSRKIALLNHGKVLWKEILASERGSVALGQLRMMKMKKTNILSTTTNTLSPERRSRRRSRKQSSSPSPVGSGKNDLSQQAAEMASQHPEYSGLRSAEREQVWDKRDRDHPNTASRVDMRRYDVRMATFTEGPLEWPRHVPSADQLARVGLFYLGVEDRVRCFSCDVELEEWENEDPLLRHYLASKHCPFLLQDFPEQLNSLRQQSSAQQAQCYANTSLRLHSFAQWPLSDIVTSYQLASVGFYYTGEGTKVICFSCGLVVKEWRRGDVPLLVHCRTNPDCQFIKGIIKGAPDTAQAPAPVLKTLTTGATNKPNFSDFQVRLRSFKKLSPAFPIPRDQLAEAGLFLLRLPDVMKCHSCDVIVQDWVEGDTAVEKHRGASPDCPFLGERFPSKLRQSTPGFDPSDLPAAQFNEKELEMMAHQSYIPPSSLSSSSRTPPTSLPADSMGFAKLSISDDPSSHTKHTLTESQPASLPNSQPPSLSTSSAPSFHSTSDYHSMSQQSTLSSATAATAASPYSTLQSSKSSAEAVGPTPHSSLSAGEPWERTVSLPPTYSSASVQPPQAVPTPTPYQSPQPTSLPAGGECVVCMDRPLEMVFVPCGHICVCEKCSGQISRCPICRTRTQMAVKVYFPY